MTLTVEGIRNRNRRKEINKIKRMLIFRARGYTLDKIAGAFKLKSRERVRQIIESNKKVPELQNLYIEVEKTEKFLRRPLDN